MSDLIPLILIHVLSLISPGPDVFYVLNASSRSLREGILSGFGIFLGNFVLVFLVLALGSHILNYTPSIFPFLKVLGAFYLVFVGIRIIQSTYSSWDMTEIPTPNEEKSETRSKILVLKSCGMCISNPKAVLYFTSFLPPYLFKEGHIFWLGATLVLLLGLFWFLLIAVVGNKIFSYLTKRKKDFVNLMFGAVLIAFSLSLILSGMDI